MRETARVSDWSRRGDMIVVECKGCGVPFERVSVARSPLDYLCNDCWATVIRCEATAITVASDEKVRQLHDG